MVRSPCTYNKDFTFEVSATLVINTVILLDRLSKIHPH